MLWLYLHFSQLTLDTQTAFPLPENASPASPLVVYQASDNCIRQRCQLAKSTGIEVGMGMAQAAALSARLTVIDYQADTEAKRLSVIAHRLYQIAADIVIYNPDCLAMRVDTLIRYYGGAENFWLTLRNELTELQVNYHYACGWSIESARVLAFNRCNQFCTDPRILRQLLQACPMHCSELTPKQRHSLNRVGIKTLAHILALPATELGKRFDNQLIRYLCALRGEVTPQVSYFHPSETFSSTIEPAYEINKTQQLLPWVNSLLNELMVFLRLRNKVSLNLELTLRFREHPSLTLSIGSACAIYKAEEWQTLCALHIEQLRLPAPVTGFQLVAENLEAISEQTNDFFSDRNHYFSHKQLIGRLQARLGDAAVWQPFGGNDHRVEFTTCRHPTTTTIPSFSLPTFCLPQPIPLIQASHVIYGPVRLQTGWWDAKPVKRDYFVSQTDSGQYLHIFKNSRGQWFIHGWYS
ncbi:DNA polymerase Y family protein [Alteromonas pelagimontana]|uniref:DNA polymerase Y family protein n=1 Tax=Alteromonas pelagimontana TaxID=1858656 RepID=A0A6M4MEJ9_9ALTE|nr:DNA polymerase Y family protein [Alteromonas pelagimontana]QJR81015.1 DNA polymerase Y family protein [Alteromonas pelagimontana]